MSNLISVFSDLASIVSCIVAIISLILTFVMWRWTNPSAVWQGIRPKILNVALVIALLSSGYFIGVNKENIHIIPTSSNDDLHLDDIPFYLGVQDHFYDEYTLPVDFSLYNVAPNASIYKISYYQYPEINPDKINDKAYLFSFSDPVNISNYKYIVIDIFYQCDCTFADFIVYDLKGNFYSLTLGINQAYRGNIFSQVKDSDQIVRIPIENLSLVDTRFVNGVEFRISGNSPAGAHTFYLNDVYFTNDIE